MTERESRNRELDNIEGTQRNQRATDSNDNASYGRRATDRAEGAPHGRRKTDFSPDAPHGRRATDRPANTRPSFAFKSFLEAWGIIIILISIVVLGVSIYSRPVEVQVVPAAATAKAPGNIPTMPGGTLTRYALSGQTSVYNFTISTGSMKSVHDYYRAELERLGWVRQTRSSETESEYKMDEGKLIMTLSYQGSRVLVQIRVSKSS